MKLHLPFGIRKALLACLAALALPVATLASASCAFGAAALVSFVVGSHAYADFTLPDELAGDIGVQQNAATNINFNDIISSNPSCTAVQISGFNGANFTLIGGSDEVSVKFVKTLIGGTTSLQNGSNSFAAKNVYFTVDPAASGTKNVFEVRGNIFDGVAGTVYVQGTALYISQAQNMSAGFSIGATTKANEHPTSVLQIAAAVTTTGNLEVQEDTGIWVGGVTFTVAELTGSGSLTLSAGAATSKLALTGDSTDFAGGLTFEGTSTASFTVQLGEDKSLNVSGVSGEYGAFTSAAGVANLVVTGESGDASHVRFTGVTLSMNSRASQVFTDSALAQVSLNNGSTLTLKGESSVTSLSVSSQNGHLKLGDAASVVINGFSQSASLGTLTLGAGSSLELHNSNQLTINEINFSSTATIKLKLSEGSKLQLGSGSHSMEGDLYLEFIDTDLAAAFADGNTYNLFNAFNASWLEHIHLKSEDYGRFTLSLQEDGSLLFTAKEISQLVWSGDANGTWSEGGSGWEGDRTFSSGSDVIFRGESGGTVTVDASGVTAGAVTVESGSWVFSGGALTINGGVAVKGEGSTATFSCPTTFADGSSISGGKVVLNGTTAGMYDLGNLNVKEGATLHVSANAETKAIFSANSRVHGQGTFTLELSGKADNVGILSVPFNFITSLISSGTTVSYETSINNFVLSCTDGKSAYHVGNDTLNTTRRALMNIANLWVEGQTTLRIAAENSFAFSGVTRLTDADGETVQNTLHISGTGSKVNAAGIYDETLSPVGVLYVVNVNPTIDWDIELEGAATIGGAGSATATVNGTLRTKGHELTVSDGIWVFTGVSGRVGDMVVSSGKLAFAAESDMTVAKNINLVGGNIELGGGAEYTIAALEGGADRAVARYGSTGTAVLKLSNDAEASTAKTFSGEIGANITVDIAGGAWKFGGTASGALKVSGGNLILTGGSISNGLTATTGSVKIAGSVSLSSATASLTGATLSVETGASLSIAVAGYASSSVFALSTEHVQALSGLTSITLTNTAAWEAGYSLNLFSLSSGSIGSDLLDTLKGIISLSGLADTLQWDLSETGVLSISTVAVEPPPVTPGSQLVWAGGASGTWSEGGTGWEGDGTTFATGSDVIFRGESGGAVTVDAAGVTAGAVTVESGSWSFSGEGALTSTTFTVASGSAELATTGAKNLGSVSVEQGAEFIVSTATGWGDAQSSVVTGAGSLVYKGISSGVDTLVKATLKNSATQELTALRLRESDIMLGTDVKDWLRSVSNIYVESGSSIGVGSSAMNEYTGVKPTLHLAGSGVDDKGALYINAARTVVLNIELEGDGATINANSNRLTLSGDINTNGKTMTVKGGSNIIMEGSVSGGGKLDISTGRAILNNAASDGSTITFDEVSLASDTDFGVGSDRTDGVWIGTLTSGQTTTKLTAQSGATTLKLKNTRSETTATEYLGSTGANVTVELTSGAWKFGGAASGALRVSGGSLILTGGSINKGLTATGGSVKIAGSVNISSATVSLTGATLSVDSGASLSIDVAGYASSSVFALSTEHVQALSGLTSITLTKTGGWAADYSLNLFSLSSGTIADGVLETLKSHISLSGLADTLQWDLSETGVLTISTVAVEPPPTPEDSLVWAGGASGTWSEGCAGWEGDSTTFATGNDVVFRGDSAGTVTVDAAGVTAGVVTVESGSWSFSGEGALTSTTFTVASGSAELATTGAKNLGNVSVAQGTELIISTATGWGDAQSSVVTGAGSLVYKGISSGVDTLVKATLKNSATQELTALRLRNSDILLGEDVRDWLHSVSNIYVESGSSLGVDSPSMNISSGAKPTLHIAGSGVGNKGALYVDGTSNRTVTWDIVVEQGGAVINNNGYQLDFTGSITNNGDTITKINGGTLWLHGSFAGTGGVLDIQGGSLLLEANASTYEVKLSGESEVAMNVKGDYSVSNLYGNSTATLGTGNGSNHTLSINNTATAASADKVYAGTVAAAITVDVAAGYWSFGGTANGALRVSGGNLVLTGGSVSNGLTATGGTVKIAGGVSISSATVDVAGATLSVETGASLSIAVAGYASSSVFALSTEHVQALSGLTSITLTNAAAWEAGYSLNLFNLSSGSIGADLLDTLKGIISLQSLDESALTWELRADGTLTISEVGGSVEPPPVTPEGPLVWNGGASGTWSDGCTGWEGEGTTFASGNDVAFRGESGGAVTVDAAGVTAGAVTVESGSWSFNGEGALTSTTFTVASGSAELATTGAKSLGNVSVAQGTELIISTATGWGAAQSSVVTGAGSLVYKGISSGVDTLVKATLKNSATQELTALRLRETDILLGTDVKDWLRSVSNIYVESGSSIGVGSASMNKYTGVKPTLHLAGSGVNDKGALYLSGERTVVLNIELEDGGATINTNEKNLQLSGDINTNGGTLTVKGGAIITMEGSVSGGGKLDISTGRVILNNAASDGTTITFDEVSLGSGADLGVSSSRSGGVWIGTLTSGEKTAKVTATAGATMLKLNNTRSETTATEYLGSTGANVTVELTGGAWKFGGAASGALKVSGGSLILTGGSVSNGLTATGGTVKIAGGVSISSATVDVAGATLSVDSGASLSIAVAGYTESSVFALTAAQVQTLSGVDITLTNTAEWAVGYSLNLFSLSSGTIAESVLSTLKSHISLDGLADTLQWDLSEAGVLTITELSVEPPPVTPEGPLVWNGGASGTWSTGCSGWEGDETTFTSGSDVIFRQGGSGTHSVTISTDGVTAGAVRVESGHWSFSGSGALTADSFTVASGSAELATTGAKSLGGVSVAQGAEFIVSTATGWGDAQSSVVTGAGSLVYKGIRSGVDTLVKATLKNSDSQELAALRLRDSDILTDTDVKDWLRSVSNIYVESGSSMGVGSAAMDNYTGVKPTLHLAGSGVDDKGALYLSGAEQTIVLDIELEGDGATINTNAHALTLSGGIRTHGRTMTVKGGSTVTMSGSVSGGGKLDVRSGRVILDNAASDGSAITFDEVSLGSGADLGVSSSRADGVWIGTLASGEGTAKVTATAGATTLKLKNTRSEASATEYLGMTGVNVELTSGAWKFGGTADGALRVSGGSLILTGGSINKGLSATGGTVKIAGGVSIRSATVDLRNAALSVAEEASLFIAVADYRSTTPALTLTADQLHTLSGLSGITLVGDSPAYDTEWTLRLLDIEGQADAGDLEALVACITNDPGEGYEFLLSAEGVLSVVMTEEPVEPKPPVEPDDDRWVWKGDEEGAAGDMVWSGDADNWNQAAGSSPNGKDVYFEGSGNGVVSIEGTVQPRSIWVKNGEYEFTAHDESSGGLKLGSYQGGAGELESGVLAVGSGDAEERAELKLSLKNTRIDRVNLLSGGTVVLNHAEALTKDTVVSFSGGELAYETETIDLSANVKATEGSIIRVRVGAAAGMRARMRAVAGGLRVQWGAAEQGRADNSGVDAVLTQGIEKTGADTLAVEWRETEAAQLGGAIHAQEGRLEYLLHAKGQAVSFTGDPIRIDSPEAVAVFTFAAGDEGALALEKALTGTGVVQLGSAADSGAYLLSANNSAFGGSIRLEGSGSAEGGAATVAAAGALGGAQTTLVLAGRSLVFAEGVQPHVAVREVVAEEGSVTYVGGAVSHAGNEKISISAPITGSGTLANAATGFDHTISGSLSGFSGSIIAGAAGAGSRGVASTWTLQGEGDAVVQASLAGTGSIVLDYDGAVRLTGRVGSDDAANNSVSLETTGEDHLVIIADAGADGKGKNTSTGALRGTFSLGDEAGAGTWAGQSVDGRLVLARGSLLNPLTHVSEGSVISVVTANSAGGATVHAGGTDAGVLHDVTINPGGHLTGVSGTLNIGAAAGLTTACLRYGEGNVGSAASSSATAYMMDIAGGAKVVETQGLTLDFSAEGFVETLRNVLVEGDAWLHTVQGGLTVDPADYVHMLGYTKAAEGDTLPQLLRSLGFEVKGVQGGDIILTGNVEEVYLVLSGGDKGSAHEVSGYNVLSSYKSTVVDKGETLTLTLQGAPTEGTADALAGGARVNNLVGLAGSTLSVKNTGKSRVALVLSNETRDIQDKHGFEEVSAQNTTFKGVLKGAAGVDLVKTGAGTLTLGDAETGLGGVQLADGDIRLKAGSLHLVGGSSSAASLTFDREDAEAAAAGGVTLSGEKTTLTLADIRENATGAISLQKGAELKLTGSARLKSSAITAGDAAGGTLTVASGAVVELVSGASAQLVGVAADIAQGGLLRLGAAKGNTITKLSGKGDLVGALGTELSITGTGGAFSGRLSGAGVLSIAQGAELCLAGATGGVADEGSKSWAIANRGTLTIDTSAAKGSLWFRELALLSGSATTLVLDTDRNSAAMLGGGSLTLEQGAKLTISSVGTQALTGRSITLASFGGSDDELRLAEADITLSGRALSHYTAGNLYFEDGQLKLDLLKRADNVYRTERMDKNARAGADMVWELTDTASEAWLYLQNNPGGQLEGVVNAVQQAYDAGAADSMARTLAAFAGASTAVLSSALAQDVQRQLSAVRTRSTMTEPALPDAGASGLHLWLTGETAYHKLNADGMAPGFTLNGWGGSVGVDVDASPATTCGLALSAMYNDLKTSSADNGNGDMDTTYLSAYARTISGAWTHTLTAAIGTADVSFNRTVSYGPQGSYTAHGSTDGLAAGVMYELGYSFIINRSAGMLLQPVLNIQYSHATLSGYTETGTDAALRVDAMEQNSLTLGMGARFQSALGENAFNRMAFVEARALVKAELGDRSGTARTAISGAGATPVEVEGAEVGAVGIEVGLGASLPLGRHGGTIFVDASADFRSGYTNMNASAGYRISF